jgi:hypothetical protein
MTLLVNERVRKEGGNKELQQEGKEPSRADKAAAYEEVRDRPPVRYPCKAWSKSDSELQLRHNSSSHPCPASGR